MSNLNKSNFKRQEVKAVIGNIEIKNPTPSQKKEMMEDARKINSDLLLGVAEELKKLEVKGDVTEEDYIKVSAEVNKKFIPDMDKLIVRYMVMLTNVPQEIMDDPEVIEDPSDDLEDAMELINTMMSRQVEKLRKMTEVINSNKNK